jgi:small subunit ribosomal protein S6
MREYENLIIFDPEIGEEKVEEKVEEFKSIIEREGKIVEISKWGVRELAYPINKKTTGYYVLVTFTATPHLLPELNRELRLSKEVFRYCIVRKGE